MDSFKFGEPGTLYFMLERDRFNMKLSQYLKIGITTGDRDIVKREHEHQTGNPRQIFSHHNIQTSGVQMLETFMHNHFSMLRVKGEWFKVDETQLNELIDFAENRATQMNAYLEELEFASNLSSLQIDDSQTASLEDPETLDLAEVRLFLLEAHRDLDVLRSNKSALAKALIGLRGSLDFPDAMFKLSKRDAKESVSTVKVRKLFPELVKEFEETKISWDYTLPFLESGGAEKGRASSVDLGSFDGDPFAIHDAYLETWASIAQTQWDYQISESQLLYLCGNARELSDTEGTLVRWEQKSRTSFSKAAFEQKYPKEALQCLSQTAGGESVAIAEWRSY